MRKELAGLGTEWKRLKQIEVDGVKYDICFSKRDGMYRAAWVCAECCEQSPWAPLSSSATQAGELAQIGIRIHHALVHYSRKRQF
jgi:hypothetical protein